MVVDSPGAHVGLVRPTDVVLGLSLAAVRPG